MTILDSYFDYTTRYIHFASQFPQRENQTLGIMDGLESGLIHDVAYQRTGLDAQLGQGHFCIVELPGGLTVAVEDGVLSAESLVFANDENIGYRSDLGVSVLMEGAFHLYRHDHSVFKYDGRGCVWTERGTVLMDRAVMQRGVQRHVRLDMSSEWLERWLEASWHDAKTRQLTEMLSSNEFWAVRPLPPSWAQLARMLLSCCVSVCVGEMSLAERLQLEGLALTLIGQYLTADDERPKKMDQRRQRAAKCAQDYLEAHLNETVSIDELARIVGMNACYLKRDFRALTGMGIAEYVRARRMDLARPLLERGGYSLTQVAHFVGYRSVSHFSRAFCWRHGCLPNAHSH